MYCELNVLLIRQLIMGIKCIFSTCKSFIRTLSMEYANLIKCLVYKMVSLMPYVMYHTKSDLKGFVCKFVIVDRLTKLLPGLFYDCFIVLLCVVL